MLGASGPVGSRRIRSVCAVLDADRKRRKKIMPGRIDGKVAVVTGAATGIGQAFARRLAEDGANVVIADLSPADDTVSLIEGAGRRALACRCDVSSPGDVANLATQVQQRFGGCDILINNAGIYPVVNFEPRPVLWTQV